MVQYSSTDYNSGDGMLTSVWGPALWHFLHTMSFNYPVQPSSEDKKQYCSFMKQLVYILPCKYCRINLKKNYKKMPLTAKDMKNRHTFSLYVYNLHERINYQLGKKSNLSYENVRNRYEHFRARCGKKNKKTLVKKSQQLHNKNTMKTKNTKKTRKKEKGCIDPLYGKRSKCVLSIVPQQKKCKSFQMKISSKKKRTRKNKRKKN